MANHKRKRPKDRRAGCLMCKYWKSNGAKHMSKFQSRQEIVARVDEQEQKKDIVHLDE